MVNAIVGPDDIREFGPWNMGHVVDLVGWTYPSNPNVPPPVPGGNSPGEGVTTVSTEALRTFAHNIGQLIPIVDQAWEQMDLAWIQAGNFGLATTLKVKMSGDAGFGPATRQFLDRTADVLRRLQNAALSIADEFENAEELNEATSADVGFQMSMVKTGVNALNPAAIPEEGAAG